MRLFSKILFYLIAMFVFNFIMLGSVSPWVMTFPDDMFAMAGFALYVATLLVDVYASFFIWRKDVINLFNNLKENL